MPCRTFEDAMEAVRQGKADLAMLPVENSTYGRVADMHSLLPQSGLHIIDEAFVRVHISLLGIPGTKIADIRQAMSHTVLLGQCRDFLRAHGIQSLTGADTAGSAMKIAEMGDPAFFQRDGAAIAAHGEALARVQAELEEAYRRWGELDG